jgi:hypothetical protein
MRLIPWTLHRGSEQFLLTGTVLQDFLALVFFSNSFSWSLKTYLELFSYSTVLSQIFMSYSHS